MNKRKLIIFHPTVAPYRLSFFNDLCCAFDSEMYLYYENLKSQKFENYEDIKKKFAFAPKFLDCRIKLGKREFYLGHISKLIPHRCENLVVMTSEYGVGTLAAVIAALIKRNIRVVSICDDTVKIAEDCCGIRRIARELIVRNLNGLIVCNPEVKRWYKERYNSNVFVFPIIQDEHIFRKNLELSIPIAEKKIKDLQLEGKKVLLYVGRIAEEKNLEYLIESLYVHRKKDKNVILAVVGDESADRKRGYKQKLYDKCKELNIEESILWVGRLEGLELMSWYNIGQIFVLPSTYEPFGAVVNEALMAGMKVVVSKYAGAACLVNDVNGVVVDVENSHIDFTDMIGELSPITRRIQIRESLMTYSYSEIMGLLIEWISHL